MVAQRVGKFEFNFYEIKNKVTRNNLGLVS